GENEAAFPHFLAIHESGRVAGHKDEYLGCIAETVVTDGDPGDDVRRDVIEKNEPQRDAAKQIEPQIACSRKRRGGRGHDLSRRLGTAKFLPQHLLPATHWYPVQQIRPAIFHVSQSTLKSLRHESDGIALNGRR